MKRAVFPLHEDWVTVTCESSSTCYGYPMDPWRLKVQRPDGSREDDRIFDDLRTTLFAARWLLAGRSNVRLAITVPPNASEAERYFISQIGNHVTTGWA